MPYSQAEGAHLIVLLARCRSIAGLERCKWTVMGFADSPIIVDRRVELARAVPITDCPVNTVKTRMFHARRRLAQLLEARGG
jgi:hypothetical protein